MQGLTRGVAALALGCAAMVMAGAARAADDDYPSHPVRWLVGYPPGGSTDICARLIGQYLSEHLHQQFAVENKPGAGNNLATEIAAHAPPDGYTVFLVNPANAINASLYKNLPFDFIRDMTPVAGFIRVPNVMEVNPNVPAHTVKEFIDYAKANPGKVNLGSSGIGTSVHLSGALFMMMTGVELVHVPYRGSAPAITDLLANQVQVMFDNLPSSLGHIQGGRLRALAVHDHNAVKGAARRADGSRNRARLRSERLVRHGGAQGHAATDHRQAQSSSQRSARRSGNAGEARRPRRDFNFRHAGEFRQSDRRRNREVVQGGAGHWGHCGISTTRNEQNKIARAIALLSLARPQRSPLVRTSLAAAPIRL